MLVAGVKNLINKHKSPLSISANRKFSLPGIVRNFNVQELQSINSPKVALKPIQESLLLNNRNPSRQLAEIIDSPQFPQPTLDVNHYKNLRRQEKEKIMERKIRMDKIVSKRLVYAGLQERPESGHQSRATSQSKKQAEETLKLPELSG